MSSAVPTSSFRDATLDVHLLGSGFAAGARAVWSRQNDTSFATTKVRTNSTTLVSPTELVANITIQADAPFGSLGIKVVSEGRTNPTSPSFSVNPFIETIDLGAGISSTARGVNNHGQVVGDRGANPSTVEAFLWDGGTITNLGVLPGMTFSYAMDISESGQVVGVSGTGTLDVPTSERGFVWTPQGGIQALSTLGGVIGSARAINDNGDIAGFSTVSGTSPGHAVVWRNGAIADLQSTFPLEEGRALAINGQGDVVGYIYGRGGYSWTSAGVMTQLAATDFPTAINNAGCVAGWAPSSSPVTSGYRACSTVRLTVGSCGGLVSKAWGMNQSGQVVGDATNAVPDGVPFRWSETDGMICLSGNQAGGAASINDNGWVVGYLGPFGAGRATLWKVK